jgi:hypothetical protein
MAEIGVCFLDNDVLLKLSAYALLDDVIAVMNLTADRVYVLESAKFVFRDSPSVIRRYSQVAREQAIAFAENCQKVHADVGSDEFIALSRLKHLDAGEAGLLTATKNVTAFVLVTGDKRCLSALASGVGIESIQQRLQGRVICLEQVILRLIRSLGFEVVKAQVLAAWDCDKSLQACFGSREQAAEANVVEALEGYIAALMLEAPGLLADMEP